MFEEPAPPSLGVPLAGPRRPGVRVYLFVLFATVACLPLTLLGVVQGRRLAAEAAADTDRQTLAAAMAFSRQVSFALQAYVRAAESLAAQICARGNLERAGVLSALAAHTEPHPEFLGSYAATPDGVSFAHYSSQEGPLDASNDYSGRDYYKEIKRTQRAAISRVQVGRVTGSPDIQIVAPIRDASGVMIGFVCTSVDLYQLSEQARVFARGLDKGRILVLDAERRVIADSEQQSASLVDVSRIQLYSPTQAAATRQGTDDAGTLVSSATVPVGEPSHGWHVIASVPAQVVHDAARHAQWLVFLVAVGAMGFALALAAFVTLRLAAPLRGLARTATLIAGGDTQQLPVIPRRGPRELLQVTTAVQRMVIALRDYARGLQVLVDERTRELTVTNRELASTLDQLEREQALLADDLSQARLFQDRLLPQLPQSRDSSAGRPLEIETHFRPLWGVGGDIYDVVQLTPTKYRIFLADATGHGVQAAMRTIVIKFEYDRLKREFLALDELLAKLNATLVELFPEGELHCTATCADVELTPVGAELTWCNGGGPPLWIVTEQGLVEEYAPGPFLGITALPFDQPTRRHISRGSTIVFSTDGLFEQMNGRHQRFDEALESNAIRVRRGAKRRLDAILEQFDAFCEGASLTDDVTLVLVHVPDID